MQEPLCCRLVIIVSVPCEQGPRRCRLVVLVFEYHVCRSPLVLDQLPLFNHHVSRGHLVVH